MARRPSRRLASEAVRTGIAAELKRLYSNVLQEPIPDRMAELLRQLDQPPEDRDTDEW
jgi:Anti-sigma factor NepR